MHHTRGFACLAGSGSVVSRSKDGGFTSFSCVAGWDDLARSRMEHNGRSTESSHLRGSAAVSASVNRSDDGAEKLKAALRFEVTVFNTSKHF